MTIKQARNLKLGDSVKQKMHGYVMKVESIEDSRSSFTTNEYVNVICRTSDGSIMKHTHKELLLYDGTDIRTGKETSRGG